LKKEKGKSHKIAEAVKSEIASGKMRPGNRLKSVRELASYFSVSTKAAQRAFDTLEIEGFVERRQGSGTFVRENKTSRSNTVYFLVPHASHIASSHESSVMLNRILYGITSAPSPRVLPQLVPVSKQNVRSITKTPSAIDWATLEQIPAGANVFASALWYNRIFPFLVERGVKGLLLVAQYEQEQQKMYDLIRDASWSFITIDRFAGIQKTVEYLYRLGRRRIAAIKRCPEQPEHPFRKGFITAYENYDMVFKNDFFHEITPEQSEGNMSDTVYELFRKTKFDSLILCNPNIVGATYSALAKIGLKVPDDVAVIAFRDMPEYVNLTPAVSAFDFSWADIGREISRIFTSDDPFYKDTRFHSSIIKRGSTEKNMRPGTDEEFMTELSYAQDIMQ